MDKYEEALERARQGMPIDEVFPELKESEDERTRKLLVWQVYRNIEDETNDLAGSVYDGVKGHDPDLEESIEDWKKCLAWLEKQKEQKPAEWSEENLEQAIKDWVYDNDCRGWEDKCGNICVNLRDIVKIVNHFATPPHWKPSEEQPDVDFDFQVFAKEMDAVFNLPKEVTENTEEQPLNWEYAIARHFYGLRNRALEEAARHVYESWMGGTMDDVRRDMVALGKVLNARKEE